MGLQRTLFRSPHIQHGLALAAVLVAVSGCGGSGSYTPPPIVLTVSLGDPTITVPQGGTVYAPVTIDAPTETVSFAISGLPGGVSESYKESESNPSGQLIITANAQAAIGAYKPTITVGSSGQTTSLVFTLVVTAPGKANDRPAATSGASVPNE